MSRTCKTGLDYFPIDVDFFIDEKIEFVSARYEEKGELIAIKLLCKIYRSGYFLVWGQDESLLFSKRAGDNINQKDVDDVIAELLKRDFFNSNLHRKYGILTSCGIQKRYFEATKRRKKVDATKEYLLVNVSDYNVNILALNVDIGTQRKVKESKGKKSERETPIPKDFEVSERVEKWAKDKGHKSLESHLENFVLAAKAKGYKYTDWDSAFMRAIRDNWANINIGAPEPKEL